MQQTIYLLRSSATLYFAAAELAKYLRLISATPVTYRIEVATAPVDGAITLGTFADGIGEAGTCDDPAQDDAVSVDVSNGAGSIGGRNERGVLLGVYRFLNGLGCRWVRPGADGEYLPRQDISQATVRLREEASARHRVVCIEGSVNLQHVLEIIDWAPKVGFSGFFMQFPDGFAFFEHWYTHQSDPAREAEPFSREASRAWGIHIEQEIVKRQLSYHAVGHGWTCVALGSDLGHWNPQYIPLTPDDRSMLADVKGVRDYQWDRPMLTSLCFSRHDVRERMVQVITDYALQHPEVDLLHVWLDDGGNNKCECAQCRAALPADWYAQLLHELDAALTAAGSAMRIVFLGYSDLLWPPLEGTKPLSTDRFVFMYANSRSSFPEGWGRAEVQPTIPRFTYNANHLQRTAGEFHGFLQGWQEYFTGDSFIFEYYLCSGLQALKQFAQSRQIHEDITHLRELGLNGMVSCQAVRASFPTGLPMYAMGQTLWNDQVDYAYLMDDYFFAAFGEESARCKEFLKVSSEEVNQIASFTGGLEILPEARKHLIKLDGLIRDFEKVIEHNLHLANPCHARSWYYVRWYVRILSRLSHLFSVIAGLTPGDVLSEWQDLKLFVTSHQESYHVIFDDFGFTKTLDSYIINGKFNAAPEAVVQ